MNWEAFISSFFGFFGLGQSLLYTECREIKMRTPQQAMQQDVKKVMEDIGKAFNKLKNEPKPAP